MHIYIYTHTYIHTYIHTYTNTYMNSHMHTCINTYIHTHIHAYIPLQDETRNLFGTYCRLDQAFRTLSSECMVGLHAFHNLLVYVRMIWGGIRVSLCVYVCMYVCMYLCLFCLY